MATLREAVLAALRALVKGKSFIQALLAHWFNPASKRNAQAQEAQQEPDTHTDNGHVPPPGTLPSRRSSTQKKSSRSTATLASSASSASASASSASSTSSAQSAQSAQSPPSPPSPGLQKAPCPLSLPAFLDDAEHAFLGPVQGERLQTLAHELQAQFRDRLLHNAACMLPSYNTQLPAGTERGRFLSLDVGGSTLRVALIELRGDATKTTKTTDRVALLSMSTFKITPALKQLVGMAFFEWMAERIAEVVDEANGRPADGTPLKMGLAWSFPIEQTSLRGGTLQGMGKGFCAADDALVGQDLGDIIEAACRAKGLSVALAAIVNDSAACLLAQAYADPSTRFGLILGTGVNVAVHLPVATVGRTKFGARGDTWFATASHVIVNTELSMFGGGLLPVTRWDARLSAEHPRPDFQPLEHMVSGYYLGEVVRHALVEAVTAAGLFGGVLPPSLATPYSLDTELLSRMAADTSDARDAATAAFAAAHACTPSPDDIRAIGTLAQYVSQRSAALVAASVYAMWALKAEAEQALAVSGAPPTHTAAAAAEHALVRDRTVVSFNGSVIERYPAYLVTCQGVLDSLAHAEGASQPAAIQLVPAHESSLIGAAVALSCLD